MSMLFNNHVSHDVCCPRSSSLRVCAAWHLCCLAIVLLMTCVAHDFCRFRPGYVLPKIQMFRDLCCSGPGFLNMCVSPETCWVTSVLLRICVSAKLFCLGMGTVLLRIGSAEHFLGP